MFKLFINCMYVYMYVCMYICINVCSHLLFVCMCIIKKKLCVAFIECNQHRLHIHTHTIHAHTHTHTQYTQDVNTIMYVASVVISLRSSYFCVLMFGCVRIVFVKNNQYQFPL